MNLRPASFSLSRRLALLVVASTSFAVLVSSVAVITFETRALRDYLVQELGITADMLAQNSSAPVAFSDPEAATKILNSLRSRKSVVSAVILDLDGNMFAQYLRDGADASGLLKAATGEDDLSSDGEHLQVHRVIINSSGVLGIIVIRSDLAELHGLASRFKAVAGIVAVLSCMIAVLLSSRLQRSISLPIRSLAEIAGRVQREADFSLRASKSLDDETGVLVDAFNEMLQNIEERDLALAQYRDELERLVERRTKELAGSQTRLRRAERLASVGTLAAGIAHQINNPIGAILNSAQHALLCENDADFKAVWKDALNRNEEQAARCGRIVRSVLQFSRNDDTERWPKNLVDVCRRACDLVEDYARDHHVVIRFTSPVNPVIVHLSPIQLEQALVNLLRNAVEAIGDQGGGVDVQLEADDKFARIEIRDNGCGIAPDHLARIFDPFFTTRLAADGTRLGLSMVYGIITDHGGETSR